MKNQSQPPSRITRRQMAGVILTTAATATAAQTPPAPPSTPAAELQAGREQNQRIAETLAKVPVPIQTEPAFHFSA
jgi:hypothetical protein